MKAASDLLETECWLPRPLEEIFAFFSDAETLNRVTPAWFRFQILSPRPIVMAEGSRINYALRWRGINLRWQSLVTEWAPPDLFVYEQSRGPYRYFRHEHHFRADRSGTLMTDRIAYRTPAHLLLGRWIARPELGRIFEHRKKRAASLFPSPAS